MPELSKETLGLLQFLLPGLLAAWVFYGLSTHQKPAQFERVIQALILAFIVRALVPVFRFALELIGKMYAFAEWDQSAELLWSALISVGIGFAFAYFTKTDYLHAWLREKKLTTRSAAPSEWASVFASKPSWVVFELVDSRRLMGWIKQWPLSASNGGHFLITDPCWIDENGEEQVPTGVGAMLIATADIRWVEFLRPAQDF